MSSSGSDDDEEMGPNSGYYCVLNGSDVEESVHSVSPPPQTGENVDVDEDEDAKSVGAADPNNTSLVSEQYGSPMEVTVFHDQQSRSFAQHRSLNAAVLMGIKADMEANTMALLERLSLSDKPTSAYLVSDTGIDHLQRQRLPKSTPIRPLPFQSMPLPSSNKDKTDEPSGDSNFRHNATLPSPDWTEAKVEADNDESTQLEIAYRRLINRRFYHHKQQQSDQSTSDQIDEHRLQSNIDNHKNHEVDHHRSSSLSPVVPQYSPISSTSSPIPPPVLKSPIAAEPTAVSTRRSTKIPKNPTNTSTSRTSSFLPSNFIDQSDHRQLSHQYLTSTELVRPSARYTDRTRGFSSSRQSEPIENLRTTDDRRSNNSKILQSAPPIRCSSAAIEQPFKQQKQSRAEIGSCQSIRQQQQEQRPQELGGGRSEHCRLLSNSSSHHQSLQQPRDESLGLFQPTISSHPSNQSSPVAASATGYSNHRNHKPPRPSSSISLPAPPRTATNSTTSSSDHHLSRRSNTSQGGGGSAAAAVKIHGITVTDLRDHLKPKTETDTTTLHHFPQPPPCDHQRSSTPSTVSIADVTAYNNIVDLNGTQIPRSSLDNLTRTRTPEQQQQQRRLRPYSPISPVNHNQKHKAPSNNNLQLTDETDVVIHHCTSPSSTTHQTSATTFLRSIPLLPMTDDNDDTQKTTTCGGKPRKGPRIHMPKTESSKSNNNANTNANNKQKSSNSRRPTSAVSLPSTPVSSSSNNELRRNNTAETPAHKTPIRPKSVAVLSKREKSLSIATSFEEEPLKKPKETRKQKFSKDDPSDDDPSSSLKLLADTAEQITEKQERLLNKSLSSPLSSTKRSKKSTNKAQSTESGRKSAPTTVQQGGSHSKSKGSNKIAAISSMSSSNNNNNNNSPKTTAKQQLARAVPAISTPEPSVAGVVDESSDIDAALGLDDEFYRKANEQDEEEYLDEQPVCKWKGCELNGIPFPREKDYFDHIKLDHINNQIRLDCEWDGCERDGRSFRAKYMLDVHCRKHSGEKPYKCTLIIADTKKACTKRYSRLENLRTHIRSHGNEKPFKCEYPGCEKSFGNNSDRAKHQNRTHSNHKSYVCEVENCDKAYTDPSSLRKHVKNTHGEEFYKPGAKRTKKDNPASTTESKFKDPNETLPSVRQHHNNSKRKDSKSNSKRAKNSRGPQPPASIKQQSYVDDVEDGESMTSGSSSFTKDYSSPSVVSMSTNASCSQFGGGRESKLMGGGGGGGEVEEEDNSLILDVTGFDKVKILYKKSQNPLSREDEASDGTKNQNRGKKKSKNVLLLIDQNDPKQKIPNISAEPIEEQEEEQEEEEEEEQEKEEEEAEESAIGDDVDVDEIDDSIVVDEIDDSIVGDEIDESIVVDEIDDQHSAAVGQNTDDDDNGDEDNAADSCLDESEGHPHHNADDSGLETMDTQTDGDCQMDQTLPYTLAENSHARYHRLHNGRSKFCNSVPPLLDGDGSGAIRERHTVRLLENTRAQDERPSTAMNQEVVDRTSSANMNTMTDSKSRMDDISDATDCVHCGSKLTETELEVSKQKLCVSCLLDGHGIAGGSGGSGHGIPATQTLQPYNDYNNKTTTTASGHSIERASIQMNHSSNHLHLNGNNRSLPLLQHRQQQQQQQQQQTLPCPNEHQQYNHQYNHRNLILQPQQPHQIINNQPHQRQQTARISVQAVTTSEPGGFVHQIDYHQTPRIYNNNTSTPTNRIITRRLLYPTSAAGGGKGGRGVRSLPPNSVNFTAPTSSSSNNSPADSNKTSNNSFSAYYHNNLLMNSSSSTLHSAAASDDHNNYCSGGDTAVAAAAAAAVGGGIRTVRTESGSDVGAAAERSSGSDSNDTVIIPDSLLEVDNLIQNAISEHHRRHSSHHNSTTTGRL